jgi:hypothetical protein
MAGVLVAFTGLGKKIPPGMEIGASWSIRQTRSGQIRKHRCMNNFQSRLITVGKEHKTYKSSRSPTNIGYIHFGDTVNPKRKRR